MPQPVLTKYKQGDLGADYPKQKPSGVKTLNLSSHNGGEADPDVSTKDYPKQNKQYIEPSFFAMADKKDY
jgi:hypothetical protein|tara:strand:- start:849 stop:1058 length:210 start_codon:yes stop_codon:yes gene_type:complete